MPLVAGVLVLSLACSPIARVPQSRTPAECCCNSSHFYVTDAFQQPVYSSSLAVFNLMALLNNLLISYSRLTFARLSWDQEY